MNTAPMHPIRPLTEVERRELVIKLYLRNKPFKVIAWITNYNEREVRDIVAQAEARKK